MHRSRGGSGEVIFTREDHGTEEQEEEEEQDEEERCLAKKSGLNGDEELLVVLKRFRRNWTRSMSPYVGPVDATTSTPPY